MNNRHRALAVGIALFALLAAPAAAQPLGIASADSMQSVLAAQKGKRVTVRLRSGAELTGTVQEVNSKLAVLAAIQGREFFDGVVALDAVEAVVVRKKE